MLLDVIRQYGLPMPVRNHVVHVDGIPIAELDLAYPDNLLDLEAQGGKWHSTRRQRIRDAERQARLGRLGWNVELFDYDTVVYRPEEAAAQISTALCGSTAV